MTLGVRDLVRSRHFYDGIDLEDVARVANARIDDADLPHVWKTQRPAIVRGAFMGERFASPDRISRREVFGPRESPFWPMLFVGGCISSSVIYICGYMGIYGSIV